MSMPLDIIIVERLGSLKLLSIKDFKQEELFKKCGFKEELILKINMIFLPLLIQNYFMEVVQLLVKLKKMMEVNVMLI